MGVKMEGVSSSDGEFVGWSGVGVSLVSDGWLTQAGWGNTNGWWGFL
jgi:hypothetical protein